MLTFSPTIRLWILIFNSKNMVQFQLQRLQGVSHKTIVGAASTSFRYKSTSSTSATATAPATTTKLEFPKLSEISEARIAQPGTGKIYDKKPFKIKLIKGVVYSWCCCGYSRTQPFCDLTHTNQHLRIKLKPIRFIAPETQEVWLCNCKQTAHRPWCDGTHRNEDVQSAIKS